jgi:hypothetical protein
MFMLPRYVRYRNAPGYLDVDRSRFDSDIRPGLVEIPIGERGIAFDRLDLDAWADDHKARNGRPRRKLGEVLCEQGQKASKPPAMVERKLTRGIEATESMRASEMLPKTRPKRGSVKSNIDSTPNLTKAFNAISALPQNVI